MPFEMLTSSEQGSLNCLHSTARNLAVKGDFFQAHPINTNHLGWGENQEIFFLMAKSNEH